MLRTLVSSSNIRSIGWDNNILEVEFKNRRIYQYLNVPYVHFVNLLNARSAGTYLHAKIKKVYRYKRIR